MDVAIAVAGTLIGVIVGALLTNRSDTKLWVRSESLAAGMSLVETYDYIWGDLPHGKLVTHLAKLRVRLEAVEVPDEQISALADAALKCWSSGNEDYNRGDENWGLSNDLLGKFRVAMQAIETTLRAR